MPLESLFKKTQTGLTVLEYLAYTLYPKEWTNFGQRLMQMQPVSEPCKRNPW
jgi:hypothetical protein